jgi:hypothetical protein
MVVKEINIKVLSKLSLKFSSNILPSVSIFRDLDNFEKPLFLFILTKSKTVYRIEIKTINKENVNLLIIK